MTGRAAEAPLSNAGTPAPPERRVSLVDVRVDGALIRRLSQEAADQLVSRGWADWRDRGHRRHLELTAGAPLSSLHGWNGRPDLDLMRREDPERYAALWRGRYGTRTGKGALGRRTIDATVVFKPERPSAQE